MLRLVGSRFAVGAGIGVAISILSSDSALSAVARPSALQDLHVVAPGRTRLYAEPLCRHVSPDPLFPDRHQQLSAAFDQERSLVMCGPHAAGVPEALNRLAAEREAAGAVVCMVGLVKPDPGTRVADTWLRCMLTLRHKRWVTSRDAQHWRDLQNVDWHAAAAPDTEHVVVMEDIPCARPSSHSHSAVKQLWEWVMGARFASVRHSLTHDALKRWTRRSSRVRVLAGSRTSTVEVARILPGRVARDMFKVCASDAVAYLEAHEISEHDSERLVCLVGVQPSELCETARQWRAEDTIHSFEKRHFDSERQIWDYRLAPLTGDKRDALRVFSQKTAGPRGHPNIVPYVRCDRWHRQTCAQLREFAHAGLVWQTAPYTFVVTPSAAEAARRISKDAG
jgi:hypothetical protein